MEYLKVRENNSREFMDFQLDEQQNLIKTNTFMWFSISLCLNFLISYLCNKSYGIFINVKICKFFHRLSVLTSTSNFRLNSDLKKLYKWLLQNK